jgi:hypothetical protein
MRNAVLAALGVVWAGLAACTSDVHVQCADNADCNIGPSGECVATSAGRRWCAYQDPSCPGSMQRFSQYDVGDGLAGSCRDPRPTVVATTPVNGENDVGTGIAISVEVSEPVLPSSAVAAVSVHCDGISIAGESSYDEATHRIWFRPSTLLNLASACEITVSSELVDLQGNRLGGAHTSTFTTRDGVWGPVQSISYVYPARNYAHDPYVHISMSKSGNGLVYWVEPTEPSGNSLRLAAFGSEGSWGTQVGLGDYDVTAPQAFVDAGLFTQRQRAGGTSGAWEIGWSTIGPDGIWSQPPTPVARLDVGSPREHRVNVDRDGNATVAWVQYDNERLQIWSVRFDAGSRAWGPPIPIDEQTIYARSELRVASLPHNESVLAWSTRQPWTVGHKVFVSEWEQSRGWSPPRDISEGGSSDLARPALATDEFGGAVVVWQHGDDEGVHQIRASRRLADGTWTPSVALSPESMEARDPRVVSSRHGDLVTIWKQYDGSLYSLWGRRFDVASKTWLPAEPLEDQPGLDVCDLALVGDPVGNATVVWSACLRYEVTQLYARRFALGQWQPAVQLVEFEHYETRPVLAASELGNVLLVWDRYDAEAKKGSLRARSFR